MTNYESNNSSSGKFPSFDDIESACRELYVYNEDHAGIAAVARRIVKPMVEELDRDQPSCDEESELALDLTSMTTGPIFAAIGLNRYETQRHDEVGKRDGLPGRQGLYVDEPALFNEFIEAYSARFKDNEFISDMVAEIYQNMLIDIENIKGGERDAVLGDLEDITEIIKKVSFANKKPNLELGHAFVNWSKKPEFEDFLIKRKLGLREKDSNSASTWHLKTSGQVFIDNWRELFDFIEKIIEKYGEENELVVLTKLEIQEALSEVNEWIKSSKKN